MPAIQARIGRRYLHLLAPRGILLAPFLGAAATGENARRWLCGGFDRKSGEEIVCFAQDLFRFRQFAALTAEVDPS